MPEHILASNSAIATSTEKEWYAAYTMSRHEKQVASYCARIGIEYFLPLYHSKRVWKNRTKVDLKMPLFPNYIFVQLAPGDYGPLLRIPGILSTVGNAAGPVAIPEVEIDTLRRVVRCNRVEPHLSIAIGDRIRVTTGPLRGIAGVVLRKGNSIRLVVTLDLIGKGVSVEIDPRALEIISPPTTVGVEKNIGVA